MNNFFKACLSASFMLLASTCFFAQAKRWYVDSTAISSSNPDGSSWQRAFPDLQQALQVAKAGDSIWVAEGTYYPTTGLDRSISFNIPNGVSLIGGFKGVENHWEERVWQDYRSILSGNMGNKDTGNDNAYHVLALNNVDSTTLIDGFWIERGAANASGNRQHQQGAGIFITNTDVAFLSNPRIHNCVFQYNNARIGGGIGIFPLNRMHSVKIQNCTFVQNSALYGAAIYLLTGDTDGGLDINTCTFKANQSFEHGPTVYSFFHGNLSMRNSTFEANESIQGGGGIVIGGDVFLDGCTFTNNRGVSAPVITILTPIRAKPAKTTVTINKTSFISNGAGFDGGTLSISSYRDEVVDVLIQESEFRNNRNSLGAQVMNIVNGSGSCKISFRIDRCTFERNYIHRSDLWRNPTYGMINIINYAKATGGINGTISNCTFFKNDRPINIEQDSLAPTKLSILNSTFIGSEFGTIIKRDRNPSQQAEVYLQNNIFYENAAELSSILQSTLRPNLSGFHFNHNLFSVPSCKTTSSDTLGCGIGNIFGQYPKFVDSSSVSGLKLAPGSIAINAGRWHPELPALDLAGQPRVQDCKVDLGAYESPSILPVQDSLSAKAQIRSTPINQSLGEIGVQQITGGFPPYRLLWENGDTVRTRRNLAAGSYTLTLSDQQGCFKNYRFVVPFTTGLRDRVAQGTISLAPNPVPTGQPIKLFCQDIEPGNWELQLLDLTGKQLRNSRIQLSSQGEMPIQLDALPKGVYLLKVSKDRQVFNHKFVIL